MMDHRLIRRCTNTSNSPYSGFSWSYIKLFNIPWDGSEHTWFFYDHGPIGFNVMDTAVYCNVLCRHVLEEGNTLA